MIRLGITIAALVAFDLAVLRFIDGRRVSAAGLLIAAVALFGARNLYPVIGED